MQNSIYAIPIFSKLLKDGLFVIGKHRNKQQNRILNEEIETTISNGLNQRHLATQYVYIEKLCSKSRALFSNFPLQEFLTDVTEATIFHLNLSSICLLSRKHSK